MNLEDRIKPALNIHKGAELSNEEFQQSLYDFFEEKGIISDLRSHLRAQLVNVLKETPLGKSVLKKPDISPKIQAQNLLVAEYLLQRNYHYTLSVFSSEVPLNNAFPPIKLENKNCENDFHFATTDLYDILEALGLNRQPDIAEKLSHKYQTGNKQSLLTCILHNVPKVISKQRDEKDENLRSWLNKHGTATLNLESMIMLLKTTGVNIDIILKICELVKEAVINEVRNLRKVKDMQMVKFKKQMDQEAVAKKTKYKERLFKLESFYKTEKIRLETELMATKGLLKEATTNAQAKYDDINKLNTHISALEGRLKQQEQYLITKEHNLQERQELLENKQKLIKQQFEDMQLISSAQQTNLLQTVANVAVLTDKVSEHRDVEEKQTENDQLNNIRIEQQDEIMRLKEQNLSYQNKIQELLLRTNSLMDQMETRAIRVRRSRPDGIAQPPLGTTLSYYVGGGGEEGDVARPAARLANSSSSGDVSPSDEILQQAKLRLLQLERESVVIDKHFETLPKTPKLADNSASFLLQSFQSNVSLIRNSLNKIFTTTDSRSPPPSRGHVVKLTESDENVVGAPMVCPEDDEVMKVPQSTEVDSMQRSLKTGQRSPSTSGEVLIDTSISTLDLSAEVVRVSSQDDWVDIGSEIPKLSSWYWRRKRPISKVSNPKMSIFTNT